MDKINSSGILPPGVSIQRIYDRSDLIHVTTHTVLHNMIAGIVLIFLLQWAFLGNLRSAVIVAMTIPFALSFAIGLMVLRGESANLLSVGAIDFGLVVDATVIMVENIYRHLAEASAHLGHGPSTLHRMRVRSGFRGKMGTISRRRRRSQPVDLLRRRHHHRRLRAAVHAVRHRGTYLRSDGEDLRLRHRRRLDRHLHDRAGLELAVVSAGDRRSAKRPWCAALRRVYEPALEFVLANRIITFAGVALDRAAGGRSRCAPWGWSSCPSSRRAICGFAPPFRNRSRWKTATRYVNRMRVLMSRYPGGADRGLAAWPARRRHRRDRLLQRRILRAAEAVRDLAGGRRQGKAHAGHDRCA